MTYNLIDEPWIKVKYIDGTITEIGIRKCFEDAEIIDDILAPSFRRDTMHIYYIPTLRLLTTIVMASYFKPEQDFASRNFKYLRRFENGIYTDVIKEYLDKFHDRFDVLSSEYIVAFHHQGKLGDARELTVCYGSETDDRWKEWKNVQKQMIEKVRSIWDIDTDFINSLENKKYTNGLCYFILSVMVTSDWIVSGKHWAQTLSNCRGDIEKSAKNFIYTNYLDCSPIKDSLKNLSWNSVFPFDKNALQDFVTSKKFQ